MKRWGPEIEKEDSAGYEALRYQRAKTKIQNRMEKQEVCLSCRSCLDEGKKEIEETNGDRVVEKQGWVADYND
jgi:hypothetical protein